MDQPVTLNVRGSATREVPPDYAWVSLSVAAVHPDRAVALRTVESDLAAVRAAVADAPGVRRLVLPRVRVHEETRWNQETRVQEQLGWRAQVSGGVEVEVAHVERVAQVAVEAGADIGGVEWFLNDDNPAHREVRRDAVAGAFRAAADFADALGRPLGPLRTLADPGLLGGDGQREAPTGRAMMAMSADAGAPELDLDPEPQQVWAAVEATFEVP